MLNKPRQETMEQNIITTALDAFGNSIGHKVKIVHLDLETTVDDRRIDAFITIRIQEIELTFYVKVKAFISKAVIGGLINDKDFRPHGYERLLITNFANPAMADQLKEHDINFIDLAGNAYINHFPAIIFVKGQKEKTQKVQNRRGNDPFTKAGLKMIYALLEDPALINAPHRLIAERAAVALGTVGSIIQGLENQGHVIPMGRRGKKLAYTKDLLNRWCWAYPEKLKYKQLLGRFEGPPDFWRNLQVGDYNAQWGGEVAAYKHMKYLKPEEFIIYTDELVLANIVIQNRLKKAKDGNIFIFKKFWAQTVDYKEDNTVHPILVYADLLEFKNQRTLETAKQFYDKYLLKHFG